MIASIRDSTLYIVGLGALDALIIGWYVAGVRAGLIAAAVVAALVLLLLIAEDGA